MPYVFFDVETTGLNARFDQIVQFAAIHTDEDFNERGRINIRCRLQPFIIPAIKAMMITQRSMHQLTDTALSSHYEMTLMIHEKLRSWAPATFVGWNTIKFDEEFLRSAFYQSLLPRFITNTNGSSRFDILRLAKAANLLEPNSINVPISETGKQTFALDRIAAANGFKNQNAHDALTDVLATIHIAKLLKNNASSVWSLGNRFSNKKVAMGTITSDNPAVAVDSFDGKSFCYPFVKIGEDSENSSNVIVADLRFDFSSYQNLPVNQKERWLLQSPKPIHRIKCNASPVIMPFDELDEFQDFDLEKLRDIAENLTHNNHLCEELTDSYLIVTHREFPNKFVEEQIYNGFPDAATKESRARFHQIPWCDRPALLSNMSDKRFYKLALRLIGEHAPECLSENHQRALAKFSEIRKSGLQNEKVPWRTLLTARQELSDFKLQYSASFEQLTYEYEQYLNAMSIAPVHQ